MPLYSPPSTPQNPTPPRPSAEGDIRKMPSNSQHYGGFNNYRAVRVSLGENFLPRPGVRAFLFLCFILALSFILQSYVGGGVNNPNALSPSSLPGKHVDASIPPIRPLKVGFPSVKVGFPRVSLQGEYVVDKGYVYCWPRIGNGIGYIAWDLGLWCQIGIRSDIGNDKTNSPNQGWHNLKLQP